MVGISKLGASRNATQAQQDTPGIAEAGEDEAAVAPVEQQKLPKAFKD
jgi:hypothetical protein